MSSFLLKGKIARRLGCPRKDVQVNSNSVTVGGEGLRRLQHHQAGCVAARACLAPCWAPALESVTKPEPMRHNLESVEHTVPEQVQAAEEGLPGWQSVTLFGYTNSATGGSGCLIAESPIDQTRQ